MSEHFFHLGEAGADRSGQHTVVVNVTETSPKARAEIMRALGKPEVLATPAPEEGNPKDAIGVKKPSITAVPAAGILYEAQAMMDGAAKYGPYNWRENPVLYRIYLDAAMRHIQQLLDGEDFDPKSGVHHLGHARACLGILADARETGNLIDNRPIPGPAGDMIRRFEDTQSFDITKSA